MVDPFNSFHMSLSSSDGSTKSDDKKKKKNEHVDPTVPACDNILNTVIKEEWYKVSRMYGVVAG
jgi:hypothetical protein